MESLDPLLVHETTHFIVTACEDCDVPGYLIVRSRAETGLLRELTPEALGQLGGLLAKLEAAVLSTIHADRLYVLRFSEATTAVHFHLFPRTSEIARAWADADEVKGPSRDINGPLLFAWARERWLVETGKLSADTLDTAARIRERLRT
jgi:diadenosine tetraphosphate (Ap4A) HIT family hydrolase